MKKIILALTLLLVVTGCEKEIRQVDEVNIIDAEAIICRNGKKIWIAQANVDRGTGLTSEIIGECKE